MRFRFTLSLLLVLAIHASTWAGVVITGERVTETEKNVPLTSGQTQALAMLLQNMSVPNEQIRSLLDSHSGSALEKFTLYIEGNRMRMDSGRYSMTVHVIGGHRAICVSRQCKKGGRPRSADARPH
jgi:nitrogen fixation protein FixH